MSQEWGSLLERNPKVLWGLVADVVKDVKAGEGERKTGRRPAASVKSLDELYEVLFPVAYSLDPFPLALGKALEKAEMSQRALSIASGIHQSSINKLVSGKFEPTLDYIERCAAGLGLKPGYFSEYRAMRIGELVTEYLLDHTPVSAETLRRLFGSVA